MGSNVIRLRNRVERSLLLRLLMRAIAVAFVLVAVALVAKVLLEDPVLLEEPVILEAGRNYSWMFTPEADHSYWASLNVEATTDHPTLRCMLGSDSGHEDCGEVKRVVDLSLHISNSDTVLVRDSSGSGFKGSSGGQEYLHVLLSRFRPTTNVPHAMDLRVNESVPELELAQSSISVYLNYGSRIGPTEALLRLITSVVCLGMALILLLRSRVSNGA